MSNNVEYYEAVQGKRQFAAINLNTDQRGLDWRIFFMCDPNEDGTAIVTRIPMTILWHSEALLIEKSKAKKQLKARVAQVIEHNDVDVETTSD